MTFSIYGKYHVPDASSQEVGTKIGIGSPSHHSVYLSTNTPEGMIWRYIYSYHDMRWCTHD